MLLSALLFSCADPADQDLTLYEAFHAASDETGVPVDLLVAIAYSTTRLQADGIEHLHGGARGYGVMDLGAGRTELGPDLHRAARTLGVDEDVVLHDRTMNIFAAAHELRTYANAWVEETGGDLDHIDDWAETVAWYSGAADGGAQRAFVDQVYSHIEGGLRAQTPDGDWLIIISREVHIPWLDIMPMGASGVDSSLADNAVWADSCNYSNASRGSGAIDTIVVHTAQGSYAGTSSWFQNCSAGASAHYVLRSSDGEITQMVAEEDTAWHAGHSDTNARSIGIEQEGYIEYPETWYTDAMYSSLAELIVDIADRQGVPLDRDHIIGHMEVPGCSYEGGGGASCHTDPGTGFDWDHLMDEIAAYSGGSGGTTTTPTVSTGDLIGYVREGSIYDTAAGISGATVTLSTGEVTWTDSSGLYQVPDVPEGLVQITVEASGYDTVTDDKDIAASTTNWNSVAMTASSGGGTTTPTTGDHSPTGWQTVSGDEVTLSWPDTGAERYGVKVFVYDGSDWYVYGHALTPDTEVTFEPAFDTSYYAWTVRGRESGSWDMWSDHHYFYFDSGATTGGGGTTTPTETYGECPTVPSHASSDAPDASCSSMDWELSPDGHYLISQFGTSNDSTTWGGTTSCGWLQATYDYYGCQYDKNSGSCLSSDYEIPWTQGHVDYSYGDVVSTVAAYKGTDVPWPEIFYVADAQRFDCGTTLRVTNVLTDTCVVVYTEDGGPNATYEADAYGGRRILDASPAVIEYLDIDHHGWSNSDLVLVEWGQPGDVPGEACTPCESTPVEVGTEHNRSGYDLQHMGLECR